MHSTVPSASARPLLLATYTKGVPPSGTHCLGSTHCVFPAIVHGWSVHRSRRVSVPQHCCHSWACVGLAVSVVPHGPSHFPKIGIPKSVYGALKLSGSYCENVYVEESGTEQ